MKINALEIDAYGVWSGLRFERMADGLSVLYGPNEAGKTTILQFIRSMLYGFSPARRQYFPPVHGGRPGGMIDVSGMPGRFEIARHLQADDSSVEEVVLTAPDGTRHGDHLVKTLLSNTDEAIFNNVFAVELRELQELASLSDTQAAELLYNLTAGLDRISLAEVMRELQASRDRILDAGGKSSQITQLWAEREKIRSEIEELGALTRRWRLLSAQRIQVDRDLIQLEEDKNHAQRQLQVTELAMALRDRWTKRKEIQTQLEALGPLVSVPEGAIERLDSLNARIKKHLKRIKQLQAKQDSLRTEAASLEINEPLRRQAARIEALQEQQPWIASLQTQIEQINSEIGDLQNKLTAQWRQLGLDDNVSDEVLSLLSNRSLASLRSPARTLQHYQTQFRQAKREQLQAEKTVRLLAEQIESALNAKQENDLGAAMDRRGNIVAQFRRRLQIDERLDQLASHQVDMEQKDHTLAENQLLGAGVLAGLGAVFVLGVVLILAGLFMPASIIGSAGWALAVLGLAGSGAAASGKFLLEKSRHARLNSCQKQLAILKSQIEQTKTERDQLDAQLPPASGSVISRLEAAETELASLEELVPLETQRYAAKQQFSASTVRMVDAKKEYKSARRQWHEAIKALDLPESLSVVQIRRLSQCRQNLVESKRRLDERQSDVQRMMQEWEMLASRITQIAADAQVALDGHNVVEHLEQLSSVIEQQEAEVSKREAIHRRIRQLRLRSSKHEEAAGRLKHRRRGLFFEVGAGNEDEFRLRALQHDRAKALLRERNSIGEEIAAAIGNICTEATIRKQLDEEPAVELESKLSAYQQRLAATESQIRQRVEQRGELAANIHILVDDRRLQDKQLELAMVENKMDEAINRWQVLATTYQILDRVRQTYERERQPETLQEASEYLHRLTQGRYQRVWTPLGENVLRVDDAEGRSLEVEMLSRGTREQLFLSLRMALAAGYARRGAALPLVLDDVLVNFDADRAVAAASVLRDFACAGHQLLIFTCHEHIATIFQSLNVPVSRLPGNNHEGPTLVTFETPVDEAEPETKRPRNRASKRKTTLKAKSFTDEIEVPQESADVNPHNDDDQAEAA